MKQAVILLAIALMVALAAVLIFLNQSNTARDELAAQEAAAVAQAASEELAIQEAEARAAKAEAARQDAEEAARMAKATAEKAGKARQARLDELNAKLATEADARELAEEEAAALAAQMKQLEAAMEATRKEQEAIAARQAALDGPVSQEHQQVILDIEKRKAELAMFKAENERLARDRDTIIERQITLEEAIIKEGGTITIPGYRVWSPNFRPQGAKERSATNH